MSETYAVVLRQIPPLRSVFVSAGVVVMMMRGLLGSSTRSLPREPGELSTWLQAAPAFVDR